MSLIKCPECGKEVSSLAANGPNCGCPIANQGSVPSTVQIRMVSDAIK